jgi:hypothetical protein
VLQATTTRFNIRFDFHRFIFSYLKKPFEMMRLAS